MDILEQFVGFSKEIEPEIRSVSLLLSNKLSEEPERLISDLREIEIYGSRIGALLAESDSYLDRVSFIYLPAKDSGTEMNRKIELDSKVAPFRLLRDHLESLADSVRTRINLGQSLLKYHAIHAERRIMEKESKPF